MESSRIRELVEQATQSSRHEFEVRIGRSDHSGHIRQEDLDRLDRALRESPRFESSTWAESHCFYYHAAGRPLRTECTFCSSDMTMQSQTICKRRLGLVDTPLNDDWTVRFALSDEAPIQTPPELVKPEYVRIRQRASHEYRSKEGQYTLRYDLTRTWAGASKSEAESYQFSQAPTCELELELVAHKDIDVERFVHSLSLKIADIARLLDDTQ